MKGTHYKPTTIYYRDSEYFNTFLIDETTKILI